jgi:hypothetical protein
MWLEGGDRFTQQALAVTQVAAESDCDGDHKSQGTRHKSQVTRHKAQIPSHKSG